MEESMPFDTEPTLLAMGTFVDVAHEGTGDVKVYQLGSERIVRLEQLDVLNGPDLRVLLSKESMVQSSDALGSYIELGKLKGNKGNQNYLVPQDVDLSEYHSVIIYCNPFHVVFNSASLQ